MEGQKELRAKKFQEVLTEIGHELQPRDVESFKDLLKERLPTSLLDKIDSRGRNSGLEFLKKLQEEGHLAEDNLELLKELFQAIGRGDLLEKLIQFEEKVKELEKFFSEGTTFSATRDAGSLGLEESITGKEGADGRASLEKLASYSNILDSKYFRIGVEGGFHDLSSLGVLLQIPPNAVTRPTKLICVKMSVNKYLPTEENETLVSCCVRIYSISAKRLQKPIIVTLKHSGPSKKEGYKTIVKAWKENQWKQIQEIPEDTPLAREHFESGFIELEITEWTALAVVTRLITDTFEVTDKGCVVRSSVCDDVTVEFPEGAVDKKCSGSMKLLMMPDHTDILDGIAAYPCPMLLIDGFEGVSFKIPVKIRLPHPHPAGYPTGNVRLLTMHAPHEWKDITDEVNCVENESFIELQVRHFSGLWVWIRKVPSTVASSLSQHLSKAPQEVYFAVFKGSEVCSDVSLTMTLVCVPNHEQFEKTAAMIKEGYTKLGSNSGNKKMRPDDKAYTKVEGCYEKKLEEVIFLKFIKNDICRKELHLLRKSDKIREAVNSRRELVIFLLKKKDGDDKHKLCTFCIDETQIAPKLNEKEPSPEVQKVETVGLESVPPGPSGLCSSGTVNHPSSRTSTSEAVSCEDLEICFGDESIATIDPNEAASKVADFLNLDKLSLDDPTDDIVVKCRGLCSYLKNNKRRDIVEKIRDLLPSGMTGPLGDGNLLVKDMDYRTKEQISWSLMAAGDQWKVFAETVGVPKDKTGFYDNRVQNPVLVILEEHCGDMTIQELYVHIVESGANAIADKHL